VFEGYGHTDVILRRKKLSYILVMYALFHIAHSLNIYSTILLVRNDVEALLTSDLLTRYKNRPPMGFDELAAEADQMIQLSKDQTGEVEYPVKWVWS